jgi:hypothetical protein
MAVMSLIWQGVLEKYPGLNIIHERVRREPPQNALGILQEANVSGRHVRLSPGDEILSRICWTTTYLCGYGLCSLDRKLGACDQFSESIIHDIQPGPLLISKHPDLFWGTIASMYIGNAMLLVLNLPLIGLWVQVLKVPYTILFPLILLFCFLGVYSLNNNMHEIVIMIIFGVFGYLPQKFGFEGAPFLLAMVLGPMMEANHRRTFVYGDPLIFFKRPICAFFLFASLILIFTALLPNIMGKRKKLEVFKDKKL